MIKVNCVVKSVSSYNKNEEKRDNKEILVSSVDKCYDGVEISFEGHSITVFANDLMDAISNCHNNGKHPWRTRYRRVDDCEEE